jgi:integrase
VRYQVTVDTGVSPATGRRQQARRRYATEKEARAALAEIADATAKGQFVARSTMTVEQVCADYIAGRRKLRQSSLAKLG